MLKILPIHRDQRGDAMPERFDRISLDRFVGESFRLGERLIRVAGPTVEIVLGKGHAERRIGCRVAGIKCNCLPKQLAGSQEYIDVLRGASLHRPATQEALVGHHAGGAPRRYARPLSRLGRTYCTAYFGDDLASDLFLYRKYVDKLPIIPFGPHLTSRHAIAQLNGDTGLAAAFSDASFDDVTNAQIPGDATHVKGRALVCKT